MNKIYLHGRLTREVETKTSQSGKTIARFTVAEDDGYGDNKHANFHPCVAFGVQGENIAKYFTKGSEIVISGRIKRDSYTKDGGDKVYTADVIVEGFDFCGRKTEAAPMFSAVTDNDIPF